MNPMPCSTPNAVHRANFTRSLVDFAGWAGQVPGWSAAVSLFAPVTRYFRLPANTSGVGILVAKHT
jgi:hypothetical protein